MADDWNKKFWKPVKPRDSQPIKTLSDARKYMLSMPAGAGTKPELQRAIEETMAAAKGKTGYSRTFWRNTHQCVEGV